MIFLYFHCPTFTLLLIFYVQIRSSYKSSVNQVLHPVTYGGDFSIATLPGFDENADNSLSCIQAYPHQHFPHVPLFLVSYLKRYLC